MDAAARAPAAPPSLLPSLPDRARITLPSAPNETNPLSSLPATNLAWNEQCRSANCAAPPFPLPFLGWWMDRMRMQPTLVMRCVVCTILCTVSSTLRAEEEGTKRR